MFGWEFPPHLSGGLGTACYGLTQALTNENVKVLFVVPKLFGDEPATKVKLVSASTVGNVTGRSQKQEKQETVREEIEMVNVEEIIPSLQKITVSSFLTPYNAPQKDHSHDLEQWNYQFKTHRKTNTAERLDTNGNEIVDTSYAFTGGYGTGLMQEVRRYAEVATLIAQENDFDVIHAHDWMTYPAGVAAKEQTGKPLLVHVHATEHDRAGENTNRFIYEIEKQGMDKADKIIAVSQWTKEIIKLRYRIDDKKILVVHNGVTLEASLPEFTEPPVGSHVVTFLGRVTYQKGPHYFVSAARDVIAEFPDAHFIIAGSGDMLPQIIERVAQLKLSSHFHFTGFLKKEEIKKVLSYTNVYVMPSVSEPFGITPLEAIQAGVPVIISNQSGVAEVISHTIKVDFWDTFSLSHTICSLLKYKSLSNTLKKNSRDELKEITWEKSAQKLNTLYHELHRKQ